LLPPSAGAQAAALLAPLLAEPQAAALKALPAGGRGPLTGMPAAGSAAAGPGPIMPGRGCITGMKGIIPGGGMGRGGSGSPPNIMDCIMAGFMPQGGRKGMQCAAGQPGAPPIIIPCGKNGDAMGMLIPMCMCMPPTEPKAPGWMSPPAPPDMPPWPACACCCAAAAAPAWRTLAGPSAESIQGPCWCACKLCCQCCWCTCWGRPGADLALLSELPPSLQAEEAGTASCTGRRFTARHSGTCVTETHTSQGRSRFQQQGIHCMAVPVRVLLEKHFSPQQLLHACVLRS
jgi:hypothetical protein